MNGSILIVARNCLHLTKKAVASALAQTVPCDVMVIDNYSSDGTIWWLHTKPVVMITTIKQKSLAACWNYGIKAFWKAGKDRVLVCNSDIELRPDAYSLLDSHHGLFVTGVGVGSREQMGVSGDRSILDLISNERTRPDFSCFRLSREVTDRVGWFNEECYPAYHEDGFFHVAMWEAGIRAVCIDVPFYHEAAATLKHADEGEQARIRRGSDVNKELFRRKHGAVMGTPEYEALFAESRFGIKAIPHL